MDIIVSMLTYFRRALEAMPLHGLSNDKLIGFKKDVNLLLGESLILAMPPKPQVGLSESDKVHSNGCPTCCSQ